ncbi:hypothetical protein AURDEDRAFT_169074 [Auricularia subglabra TFB-10046 SS5]|nr:hypothetical protein AURDEDRAFT_169074 [Auricularia subglabra TFB-10046 SS5]
MASINSAITAHLYHNLFDIRAFHISGLCIMVWDYLLTLDLEIQFFWKSSRPATANVLLLRAIFFINRYLPMLTQLFNVIGTAMIKDVMSTAAVIEWFAIPGAVLCFRTCALYERNKRAVLSIIGLYALSLLAGALVIILTLFAGHASAHVDPSVGLRVCHSISPDEALYAAFIPPLVYDCAVSIAAMYALLNYRRRASQIDSSNLLTSMAQHTVMWLLIVAAADIVNLCIFAFAERMMRHAFDGVMFALVSVACSRQLLHLREIGHNREHYDPGASSLDILRRIQVNDKESQGGKILSISGDKDPMPSP